MQIKTCYLMIFIFDSAILNVFSDGQATTPDGIKACHAIIVHGRNVHL